MTDFRTLCEQLMELAEGKRYDGSDVILRARAALSQPEPVAPTDEELDKSFEHWWYEEGSIGPFGMDHEEHTKLISHTAWHNGAYVARFGRDTPEPVWDDIHYAWELHDDEGEWQAGGSANRLEDVQREGNRYLQTYAQDGPHKLIIQRYCVNTIEEMTNG